MKKVVGYLFVVLGVLVLFLQVTKINNNLTFLKDIPKLSATVFYGLGIAFMIIGVLLLGKKENVKDQDLEVPIYEGEGKKRRIIGYKKMSKKQR